MSHVGADASEVSVKGALLALQPELLESIASFTRDAQQLVTLAAVSVFREAATETARAMTLASLGEGFERLDGETWFGALRFAERQKAAKPDVVGSFCEGMTIVAAEPQGLYASGGPLYFNQVTAEMDSLPEGLLAPEHKIVQISCSCDGHMAAVTSTGKLLVVGRGDSGQLGLADFHLCEFGCDVELLEVGGALSGLRVVTACTGDHYTAAVTADGWLFTFGNGSSGCLGHGTREGELTPRRVLGALVGQHVLQVAASITHTVVVTMDGQVFTFGDGSMGQLGHGVSAIGAGGFMNIPGLYDADELTPRRVDGLPANERVVAVAAGACHTVLLTAGGAVYTFGGGAQLGHGGDADNQPSPKRVEGLKGHRVTRIAAGDYHTAVLTDEGVVLTFGNNETGPLGLTEVGLLDEEDFIAVPGVVALEALAQERVVSLTAGGYRTSVVTSSGRRVTFGVDEAEGGTVLEPPLE
jgi:alpha-tubulin suppressor-like RCC1 family protein